MELKEKIKEEVTSVVDLLYQQNIKEAYPRLVQTLPLLEQFFASFEEEKRGEWTVVLHSALEAMEQQDVTLLADILQYEILERMDEE